MDISRLFFMYIHVITFTGTHGYIKVFFGQLNQYVAGVIDQFTAKSITECCFRCFTNGSCDGANFNRLTSQCELLHANATEQEDKEDWTFYSGSQTPTVQTEPPASCEPDWEIFNNSCYLISTDMAASFANAEEQCQQEHSAHLVDIHGDTENEFVSQSFQSKHPDTSQPYLCIGLKVNAGHAGEYLSWTSNNNVTFTKWSFVPLIGTADAYPGGDCVVLNPNYFWKTYDCNHQTHYACEKPAT